jgi:hypothetical protein
MRFHKMTRGRRLMVNEYPLLSSFPIPNLRLSLSTYYPPTILRNSHCLAPTVKHQ